MMIGIGTPRSQSSIGMCSLHCSLRDNEPTQCWFLGHAIVLSLVFRAGTI